MVAGSLAPQATHRRPGSPRRRVRVALVHGAQACRLGAGARILRALVFLIERLAARLARGADVWPTAGLRYLYDIARLSDTAVAGPGAVPPEDLEDGFDTTCISFFLRLVRDVMGAQGRYVKSLNIYEQEWE